MFDVGCNSRLPLDYIEIHSLWVRGALGPMTVWTTEESYTGKHEDQPMWTQIYSRTHPPSPGRLVELRLDQPIRLDNGQKAGLYVHSGLPGDEGIVYDNQKKTMTHVDEILQVMAGVCGPGAVQGARTSASELTPRPSTPCGQRCSRASRTCPTGLLAGTASGDVRGASAASLWARSATACAGSCGSQLCIISFPKSFGRWSPPCSW